MEDILSERRSGSDFCFSLQSQNPPRLDSSVERTPQEIADDVIKSPRIQAVIEQLCKETGKSSTEITKDAQGIITEMAHIRSMTWIRSTGFFLSKVMKCLFSRVNVNSAHLRSLKPLLNRYPVVFIPSHRSYMDFLLLSYVLFCHALPCPVICAAQDFLNMKFFANVIRHCGGFFIRRSFASDKLYWNIFSQFVQTHVLNGDFPLEFFIEGTRSRTGKSLMPKLGMLSTVMELVIRGQVPDVVLVPISVSFDRILEESLYAYELLGIPKPKESASGLFKARSVLSENYASIHVIFGESIFSKEVLSSMGLDRTVYNLMPRQNNPLSPAEMKTCSKLGLEVLLRQQPLFVVSPFSIVASILLQSHHDGCPLSTVKQLSEQVIDFGRQLGLNVSETEEGSTFEAQIDDQLQLHANFIEVLGDGRVQLKVDTDIDQETCSPVFDPSLLAKASKVMQLSIYRNQMLHFFVDAAIIVRVLSSLLPSNSTLATLHRLLRNLFKPEFLFADDELDKLFQSALRTLEEAGIIQKTDTCHEVTTTLQKDHPLTSYLNRLLSPFFHAYYLAFHFLLEAVIEGHPMSDPKSNAKVLQSRILRVLKDKHMSDFDSSTSTLAQLDILSLDTLANASSSLLLNQIAKKSTELGRTQSIEIVDIVGLYSLVDQLRSLSNTAFHLPLPNLKACVPKAKL